jgi:outer membrane protein OmpA-like peptidoglycan-associated protein
MNRQGQLQNRKVNTTPALAGRILQRKCACGSHTGQEQCEECARKNASLRRKSSNEDVLGEVPQIVHDVLRSPGRPLDAQTRAFMEPRFGHDLSRIKLRADVAQPMRSDLVIGPANDPFEREADRIAERIVGMPASETNREARRRDFGNVRIHTGATAARSARAIGASAYAVGQDIVFDAGQYAPHSFAGRRLIAHELTHVIQGEQGENAALRRREVGSNSSEQPVVPEEKPQSQKAVAEPALETVTARQNAPVAKPEKCPPPRDMPCASATNNPTGVTNTFVFPVGSAALTAHQIAQIDAAAAAWRTGGSVTVRVDGFASAEGDCGYNWDLSCQRASAVADELKRPADGAAGVPSAKVELFAHGENADAGSGLALNRRATISVPSAPPSPPSQPEPACAFPVSLGSARGCGSGTDFTHHDFPSISLTSSLKFGAWAYAHPGFRPTRDLITNLECEAEMDATLVSLAGTAGHDAFTRFAAGTGGTETHGATTTLGSMALGCGSFNATVKRVKADIEAQLAAQAPGGKLNACALSVTPPETHFSFSDGAALKAVIGGTQGEELFATGFAGNIPLRSYTINLRFVICDDFGVDEADLYAPGLLPFWVLQHERSPYAPFINQLELPITVKGTF